MKKLIMLVGVCILSLGFAGFGVTAQAQAQPDCDVLVINGTGAGSNNQITCTTTVNITVECVNNIYVLDTNSQTAVSGAAIVGGNMTGNTAISGNATNQNGQIVAIGANCGQTPAQTQTVSSSTPQPPATSTPVAAAPHTVASLPFTAGNSLLQTILMGILASAIIAGVVRVGIVTYSRFTAK